MVEDGTWWNRKTEGQRWVFRGGGREGVFASVIWLEIGFSELSSVKPPPPGPRKPEYTVFDVFYNILHPPTQSLSLSVAARQFSLSWTRTRKIETLFTDQSLYFSTSNLTELTQHALLLCLAWTGSDFDHGNRLRLAFVKDPYCLSFVISKLWGQFRPKVKVLGTKVSLSRVEDRFSTSGYCTVFFFNRWNRPFHGPGVHSLLPRISVRAPASVLLTIKIKAWSLGDRGDEERKRQRRIGFPTFVPSHVAPSDFSLRCWWHSWFSVSVRPSFLRSTSEQPRAVPCSFIASTEHKPSR